ncbi:MULTISPECIES: aspartate 1-decarboxylase [unclassified Thioalkalivibrio]|uniref:aspartate 1-decarboxylase n=1 Tax=unclassified Thioalkalivibrio TaxID=2621013 RepID=UPI00019598C4|nr:MULTISPECIES: aspartate 1-decarboxylase [unclassified Thioalkalivibrio]ADC72532.1 aspartate 1-decarboxylase [Thioalkalivibrio sp. K90mix]
MHVTMLKGKLHKAQVTHCELEYEGSCAIDTRLLEAAGILPFEQIQIYNVDNGERFTTYAIEGEPGSGIISVNGAAAHKAAVGHRVIICAYAQMEAAAAREFTPNLVYLDARNAIVRTGHGIPVQAA